MLGSMNCNCTSIARYLQRQQLPAALLTGLLLAGTGLQLAVVQTAAAAMGGLNHGPTDSRAVWYGATCVGIVAVQRCVALAASLLVERAARTVTAAIRCAIVDHALRAAVGVTRHRSQQIEADLAIVSAAIAAGLSGGAGAALLLVGAAALLAAIDLRLASGVLAAVILGSAAFGALWRMGATNWATAHAAEATRDGVFAELLLGAIDLRSSGAASYGERRFAAALGAWRLAAHAADRDRAIARLIAAITAIAAALWGAAEMSPLASGGDAGAERAVLIAAAIVAMVAPLWRVCLGLGGLRCAAAAIGRLDALLAMHPSLPDGERALPGGALAVLCNHISFRPKHGALETAAALDDISFAIAPEQILGVLGSGASSAAALGQLLLRDTDPDSGQILVAGHDLRQLTGQSLRRRVGVISPETGVFAGTLRENLTLLDRMIGDRRLYGLIDELGLGAWLMHAAGDLDAIIDPQTFPPGDAQILAIVRAGLRDYGLIIVDRAAGQLDAARQQLFDRALGRLLDGRSAVILADRLETLERADQIMIVSDGRMIEYGARTRLLTCAASHYAALRRRKVGGIVG